MLGKHRFQDGPLNKKKQRCLITESLAPELPARPLSGPLESSGEVGDPSDGLLTRGGMLKYPSCGLPTRGGTIKDPSSDYLGENKGSTRKLNLDRTWKENEDRFLYNPFTKQIDFRKLRPTDYKLNKHINLPKPLSVEQEIECELRRRDYMKSFDQFTDNLTLRNNKQKE